MIVVITQLAAYGPFEAADDAMRWIRFARDHLDGRHQPFFIRDIENPDCFYADWRKPRRPMTVDGKPTTMEAMDAQMGYKPTEPPMTRERGEDLTKRAT